MLPANIKERTQYLSAEWIEQVRHFLTEHTPEGQISICESYQSPPPGINGAFWIRISNGVVEVNEGVLEDADIQIEGAYQAALELAQIPFIAGEEALNRATREMIHRWGKSGIQIKKGTIEQLPPQIIKLHDYMAARTVENPNLEFRLQEMGLERHVKDLEEQGYTIIEGAISEDFADELREVTQREVLAHSDLTSNALTTRDRLFEEILQNPYVNAVSQSVLGQSMINGALAGSYKEAGPGAIPLHVDALFLGEPFPEWPVAAVTCWALDEWTETAGPTWVVPGSHKKRRAPRDEDSLEDAVPIIMPKGSAAIWVDGVWHWQGERTEPGARVALHVTNNRVFARQLDKVTVTNEMLERNPPAFSTLMGLDDPFGKSSYQGHDLNHFMYTAKLS